MMEATHGKDERALVQEFTKFLDPREAYVYIDQDSPMRQFRSGWDFLFTRHGRTVFVEAKLLRPNKSGTLPAWPDTGEAVIKRLSDYQDYTRGRVLLSGSPYAILLFRYGERPRVYVSDDLREKLREYDAIEYFENLMGDRPFLNHRRVMPSAKGVV